MTNLEERLNKIVGEKENQLINKSKELIIDKRKNNKGIKGKAGRKPKESVTVADKIKGYLSTHFNEEVTIEVEDVETGKKLYIKKPRIIHVLETLYSIGVKKNDPDALNKWLDRALGKPMQKLGGDKEEPIHLKVDIEHILNKSYGKDTN